VPTTGLYLPTRRNGALPGALLLALVAHLAVLAALGRAAREPDLMPAAAAPAPISVITLPPPADPERREEQSRQFVSLPEPERDEAPEDARFLDRYDRRVERETVSVRDVLIVEATPARQPSASASTASPAGIVRPATASGGRARRGDAAPTSAQSGAPALPVEGAGAPLAPGGRAAGAPDGAEGDAPVDGGGGVDLSVFNATAPSAAPLLRRNDHLELEEGDRTMLNALRSTYWSFFNRMQERVSAEWSPGPLMRRFDPDGTRYGQTDRYTVLSITLESDGSLRHALVSRGSGVDALDAEAVRAFEAAAPFPNVPESLKDERGRVTFRFGFFLDYEGDSRVQRLP
jgi:TonB family protein